MSDICMNSCRFTHLGLSLLPLCFHPLVGILASLSILINGSKVDPIANVVVTQDNEIAYDCAKQLACNTVKLNKANNINMDHVHHHQILP